MTAMLASEVFLRPALPPMNIAALALAVTAAAVFVLARQWSMGPARASVFFAMRLVLIAALAVVLLGPSRVPPVVEAPLKPIVNVMLDVSGSMQTRDAEGMGRARYCIERWLTREQLAALAESFDLRLHAFDEGLRVLAEAELDADAGELAIGRTTRYADSITEALIGLPAGAGERGAMLVVIGDGHDSEARPMSAVATLAKDRGVVIHTITVGQETTPPDAAVAAFSPQAFLLAGEQGQIIVRISQAGMDGRELSVELTGPDGTTTRRPVPFASEPTRTIELPITPADEGRFEYVVRVVPQPGEIVTSNNEHTVFVEAIKRRMRVLVLEGEPYWDTKFIAQSLRTDPWVELTHITQVSATKREGIVTRTQDAAANPPRTAEELAAFDVIVLGSGIEKVFSPAMLASLVGYVHNGGNVVMARGRAYDPTTPEGEAAAEAMAAIEPVAFGRGLVYPVRDAGFRLTAAGRGSAAFSLAGVAADVDKLIARLPPLRVMPLVERIKPGANILAEIGAGGSAGAPCIVEMPYGRGRVFAVLGEGLWRWSFLPPELRDVQGVFDTFWSNTVRSLAMGSEFQPGESVSLKVSPASVRLDDRVVIDLATRFAPPADWSPKLTLSTPDGRSLPLDAQPLPGLPTRRQTEFTPPSPGIYQLTLDAGELNDEPIVRRFSVYEMNLERLRPMARPEAMATLARTTGGLALRADASIDLADTLRRQLIAGRVPPTPQFLWDRWWILLALLLWAALEWFARRAAGWL